MNCRCTSEYMRNRTSLPPKTDIEYPGTITTVAKNRKNRK